MAQKTMTAVSGAVISTAQAKIGSASGLFHAPGSGDEVTTPDSSDWDFSSNSLFSIEFWFYWKNNSTNYMWIVGQSPTASDFWAVVIHPSGSDNIIFGMVTAGGGWLLNFSISASITANTWHHVEVNRQATAGTTSDWNIFFNGTKGTNSLALGAYSTSLSNLSGNLEVGGNVLNNFGNVWDGHIDELRISKGVARHTSNFTPSTSAFVTDAQTVLLLHFEGTNGSTSFIDDSAIAALAPISRHTSQAINRASTY